MIPRPVTRAVVENRLLRTGKAAHLYSEWASKNIQLRQTVLLLSRKCWSNLLHLSAWPTTQMLTTGSPHAPRIFKVCFADMDGATNDDGNDLAVSKGAVTGFSMIYLRVCTVVPNCRGLCFCRSENTPCTPCIPSICPYQGCAGICPCWWHTCTGVHGCMHRGMGLSSGVDYLLLCT